MTFGPLGDLIHGGADLAYQGITLGHHTLDGALDKTGVSASIPPALHEISDGSLGLLRRGIHDVGSTSGNILKSFDTMSLHGQDKDIGGNLRNPRGQQLQHQGNHQGNGRPKCKKCRVRPRMSGSQFCSDFCADADDYDEIESRSPSRRETRRNSSQRRNRGRN
ncbi:hypothetical protein WG66_002176 [Moniliophthora roreri]|nr:hypothetical protein WG66_002176 [Moniliophthora roreri]